MSGYYGGGGGRIANATIKVTPDLTGFQAQLQASVDKAFAGLKVPAVGGAGGKAAKGLNETSTAANALRGSLIGLSRVTPVTVFGLGLYGTAGIAAGLAIKSLVSDTAAFESQLNTLQVITQITDEQLQQVRQTAIDLGGDTSLAGISAGDAADALTELAKAGLSVKDSLAAARGTLELAGAAEITAGAAAKFVATELNAFKLSGDQAGRVVDLLAAASIAAQGSIEDFGNAFQQVSAVAGQAGLSVEQTTAALAQLAKAGITSSDAGTSLRTFLLRLIPTTKQASAFVKALGVELDESKTQGEQLSSIIGQYRNALLALNPIQRTAVLNQIFGQDAIRAASVLLTQNTGALDRQIDALDRQGVAQDLNRAKSEGLSGAFKGLESQLETLGIQIGEVVDGPIEAFIRGLSDTITEIGRVSGKIDDLVEKIAGLKAITIPVKFILEVTDLIPSGLKTALKNYAKSAGKRAVPLVGPALNLLDAIDALSGGGGGKEQTGGGPPLLDKKGPVELPGGFGLGGFEEQQQKKVEAQRDRMFGKAADAFARKNKALRAKVAAELKKQAGGSGGADDKKLDLDLVPTQALQVNLLNAQISGSLPAELAADRKIVAFFEKRLAGVKANKPRYLKILKSLQSANAAVRSVVSQINQEREAALREQQQELKERQRAAEALARARLEYVDSIFDARESKAALTETKVDDIKVANQRIASLNRDITLQKKIAAAAKKGSQVQIEALTQIQRDTQAINALKLNIKNLKEQGKDKSGGGFSLADLFQESVNQFNEFAGNISTRGGQFTGGDARGQLAMSIINQNNPLANAITQAGTKNLTEAQKQTLLLEQIRNGLAVDPSIKPRPEKLQDSGITTARHITNINRSGSGAGRR